jgi:hypothetical protein
VTSSLPLITTEPLLQEISLLKQDNQLLKKQLDWPDVIYKRNSYSVKNQSVVWLIFRQNKVSCLVKQIPTKI